MSNKKAGSVWSESRRASATYTCPWNKGLTKKDDVRLMQLSTDRQGKGNPMFGTPNSDSVKQAISKSLTGTKRSKETLEKMSVAACDRVVAGKTHYVGKHGKIMLPNLNTTVHYRSSYEERALLMLDSMEEVVDVKVESLRIPYVVNNQIHNYIPDFLVTDTYNNKYIIEVKPECFVNTKANLIKFEAGKCYADMHGMTFSVWTESLLDNNGLTTTLNEVIHSATATVPMGIMR